MLTAAFLWWESRVKAPMVPLRLFRDKAFSGAQGLTFALYFSLAAITFYLPMTLIAGWRITPAEVSLVLLPLGVLMTIISPFAGRFTDRLGPGPMIAGGASLVALAFLGLGLFASTHNLWTTVLPLMLLFGLGMSFVVSPLSTAVMTSVVDHETGTASGINNAVARVAGLFAVATMGGLGRAGVHRFDGRRSRFLVVRHDAAGGSGARYRGGAGGGDRSCVCGDRLRHRGAVAALGGDRLDHAGAENLKIANARFRVSS